MTLPIEPLEAYEVAVLVGSGADARAWTALHNGGRTFVDLLEKGDLEAASKFLCELNEREYQLTLDCELTSNLAEAYGGYSIEDNWLFGEAAIQQRALDEANATKTAAVVERLHSSEDRLELTRIRNFLQNETAEVAAYTSDAIYIVEKKKRVYGFDTDYAESTVWIDANNDYDEATPEQAARLEALLLGDDDLPPAKKRDHPEDEFEPDSLQGWVRTGYKDTWEFVQPFLTREAAEDFIKRQQHNLGEARVFVASGYRNPEWKFLRRFLKENT